MPASACKSCTNSICGECDKVNFPVPPVCTARWDANSWYNYIQRAGTDKEPSVLYGVWHKTGRVDENGEALYSMSKES